MLAWITDCRMKWVRKGNYSVKAEGMQAKCIYNLAGVVGLQTLAQLTP